jgi:hypothetical protein
MVEKDYSNINTQLLYQDTHPVFFKKFIGIQDEVPVDFASLFKDSTQTYTCKIQGGKIRQFQVYKSHELRTSMFTQHQLHATMLKPQQRPFLGSNSIWLFGIILFVLVLFAILRTNYTKKLQQLFKGFAVFNYFNQLIREENLFRERYTFHLTIIFFFNLSIFIVCSCFFFSNNEFFGLQGIIFFGSILLCLILWLLIKFILIRFVGFVFKARKEASEHIANLFLLIHISGLAFLPLTIFAAFNFSWILFVTGVSIFILLYAYYFIRTAMIQSANSNFSILNFFLYLCAFEIIPFLFIIRFVTNRSLF